MAANQTGPPVAVLGAHRRPAASSVARRVCHGELPVRMHRLAGFQHGQVADCVPVVIDLLIQHHGETVDHCRFLVGVSRSG
jgi:hypothetical protein